MSNAYRIHGARYLRKYTAAEKSSCYSYMADVRKIANTLCAVPWSKVAGDVAATSTIHTEEGLDWNAPERDRFDAAEWCGEHSDGFHRAFAQAACYVFKLPTSAIGKAIQKIRVNVTSDPFNPYGARIAAMTSDTLEIPMDCATVREGDVFRAPDEDGLGAAPRLFVRNAKTGAETWYSNSEIVELVPGATLAAKQYLFVFVCLENYNRGRDGWIEGSSYIDNDVEITLASACADLVSDELNDLSQVVAPVEYPVVRDGVVPDMQGFQSGVVGAVVTAAGTSPLMNGNIVGNIDQVSDEMSPANIYGGIRSLYGKFETGDLVPGDFYCCHPNRKRIGVGFSVRKGTGIAFVDANGGTSQPPTIALTASSMFVPFSVPENKPNKIEFDWNDWLSGKSPTNGTKFVFYVKVGTYLTEYDVAVLKNPEMYRGSADVGGWQLLGAADVSDGDASFPVDFGASMVGTVLIAAYLPQDGIANTSGNFDLGTGGLLYNGITPDSVLGASAVSDYSASTTYHNGDYVRMNYDDSLVLFASKSEKLDDVFYVGGKWLSSSATGIKVSDDGVVWRNTNVMASCTMSFAFGNGRFVAVACASPVSSQKAYYSTDGENWIPASVPQGFTYAVYAVWFGGRFIASGSGCGGVIASADGSSWSVVKSDSNCGDTFVCGDVLFAGSSYWSQDGYTYHEIGCASIGDVMSVVKLGSSYYIFGTRGMISGLTGSFSVANTDRYYAAACNGSVIVALMLSGSAKYSTNGLNWTSVSIPSFCDAICVFKGRFYAAGDKVYASADGASWSKVSDVSCVYITANDKRVVCSGYNSIAYTALDYGEVYKCIVSASSATFNIAQWMKSGEPVPDRLSGREGLCIPDITLVS